MSQPKQPLNSVSPSRGARAPKVPEFAMPAMPPLELFAAIDRGVRGFIRQRRLQRELRGNAHLLDDVGHRPDVVGSERTQRHQ